ncbi:PREDICTED: neurocalcin homolog, partial [Nicotiana attenuata]|uniref:neurocalcin homolog n=1 Tax=Nicotiana attenuata TaxID=49451 RepID=UPI0009051049
TLFIIISFLFWLSYNFRERDSDKDGKVNFKEFFHGLFDLVRNYDEESHDSSHHSEDSQESPAKKLFAELDKDGDGYLSDAELLPIIGKLHPSERYYAKQQADYIIQQADADKDGRLTLKEMIDSPYVFYSAIFNEDDEDYEYHDEFR